MNPAINLPKMIKRLKPGKNKPAAIHCFFVFPVLAVTRSKSLLSGMSLAIRLFHKVGTVIALFPVTNRS
jgi:hypothetical protein